MTATVMLLRANFCITNSFLSIGTLKQALNHQFIDSTGSGFTSLSMITEKRKRFPKTVKIGSTGKSQFKTRLRVD